MESQTTQTVHVTDVTDSPGSAGYAAPRGIERMKRHVIKLGTVMAAVLFLSITVLEFNAEARAGGGRSMGGRSSRSYSRPAPSYSQPSQSRQQVPPAPGAFQQQAGGGFLRNMAGGMMGGMLGSMLFSNIARAGTGGMGSGTGSGGDIGLFEIILLAGGGYLVYRYIRKKKEASPAVPYNR